MKHFFLVVLAMLLGMASVSAHARKAKPAVEAAEDYVNKDLPEAANVWHCWYAGGAEVLCRLGEMAEEGANQVAEAATAIDERLPDIVRKIRQQAATLADTLISIPLHSTPDDMAFTGLLAESVMCGGASKPCGIIFGKSMAQLADAVRRRSVQVAARKIGKLALAD